MDAIGKTINKTLNAQRNSNEQERADKVMFVITTDGMENTSTEYNYEAVSHVVSELRASRPITGKWKTEIEDDFKHRSKNSNR